MENLKDQVRRSITQQCQDAIYLLEDTIAVLNPRDNVKEDDGEPGCDDVEVVEAVDDVASAVEHLKAASGPIVLKDMNAYVEEVLEEEEQRKAARKRTRKKSAPRKKTTTRRKR